MKNVETKTYLTFQDFFGEVLSPTGALCNQIVNTRFIYRGEKSHLFSLIPSALREENSALLKEMAGQERMIYRNQNESQINNEYLVLRDFYSRVNKQGLRISMNTEFDTDLFNDYVNVNLTSRITPLKWIAPELTEIAALAQHYGVPTRLIDWTSDVFVALYFAAIGALDEVRKKVLFQTKRNLQYGLYMRVLLKLGCLFQVEFH